MNYKQSLTDKPSIKPFGWAGVSSKNSNVVLTNSFFVKGASAVDVFDNSDLVLRDCATPPPEVTEFSEAGQSGSAAEVLIEKVKKMFDSVDLPFWVEKTFKFKPNSDIKNLQYAYNFNSRIHGLSAARTPSFKKR